MGDRYECWQQPKPASHLGNVLRPAARMRHLPRSYDGCRNLIGLGFPCGRKCSEIREDHSQNPRNNPPTHRPRNGRMYTTPASRAYACSVLKWRPVRSYRTIVRLSKSLSGEMAGLDCSDGLTPSQRGSARPGG